VNEADLSWPEDPGFHVVRRTRDAMEDVYVEAQASLALAGTKRERYGRLPGRDPELCAQLNADVTAAQEDCDAAREALVNAQPQPQTGPPLVE
jgi:hypothetical protein